MMLYIFLTFNIICPQYGSTIASVPNKVLVLHRSRSMKAILMKQDNVERRVEQ